MSGWGRSDQTTVAGTVTATQASDQVVGAGTGFLGSQGAKAGATLNIAGVDYVVKSVESATALTLTKPYAATTGAGLTILGRQKPLASTFLSGGTPDQATIYGVDATEIAVTAGVAHAGWVSRRVINAGTDRERVLHETLVAMKSPPTEPTDPTVLGLDDVGSPQVDMQFVAATNRTIVAPIATTFPVGTVTQVPTAYGTLTYQWQESTNNGASFSNLSNGGAYSNVTTATLGVVTATSLSGNKYRCKVTSTNGSNVAVEYSPAGTLTATPAVIAITAQPGNQSVTAPAAMSFSVTASITAGATLTYAWQESADGGTVWTSLVAAGVYSNVATATLGISDSTGLDTYQYRCYLTGNNGAAPVTSTAGTATVA